jgi:hypothetical protein
MKAEKKSKNYTVPEIVELHKGLECNGDFYCDYCEEQEHRWGIVVSDKYKSMNNIFINRKLGEIFVEKWLEGVLNLDCAEQEQIKFIWPPLRNYTLRKNCRDVLYEYGEFISELIRERDRTYHGYFVRPKVEFEFIMDLQQSLRDYSIEADLCKLRNYPNQYNEIYMFLSHILTYVSYMLYIDKKRCCELIDIFNTLLDE